MFWVITMIACNKSTPSEVVDTHIQASMSGNSEDEISTLCLQDQVPYRAHNYPQAEPKDVQILSTSQKGDEANVVVQNGDSTEQYRLIKEDGRWCIFLNVEITDQMIDLSSEASDAHFAGDLELAHSKLTKALSLDPEHPVMSSYLQGRIDGIKEVQEYMNSKIAISDLKRTSGVTGTLKNTGDRTIELALLTVYGLDSDHQPVFEFKIYAVFSDSSSSDSRFINVHPGPVKPNYEVKFIGRLPRNPSDSWTGELRAEVTRLRLL